MSGRPRSLLAPCFALGLLSAFQPARAHAAEAVRSAQETKSSSVEIYVEGSPAVIERLRVTAAEMFGRAAVTASVNAGTGEASNQTFGRNRSLARAYVDLRNPLAPRVVVVDGATERELTRRTLEESASLETSIEAVTLVLYMAVEALITSGTPTRATEESAPPAPAPAASSPPAPRPAPKAAAAPVTTSRTARESVDEQPNATAEAGSLDVRTGVFFRAVALDSAHTLAGVGAAVELSSRDLRPQLGAMFLAAAHLSTNLAIGEARASIETYSFRLLPTLSWPMGSAFAGTLGVGGGLDYFAVEARQLAPSLVEPNQSAAADGVVTALAGVRWRLAERLHASVLASLDVDLTPRAFVAQSAAERQVLLELSRLRPALFVGLSLGLTSEAHPTAVASLR